MSAPLERLRALEGAFGMIRITVEGMADADARRERLSKAAAARVAQLEDEFSETVRLVEAELRMREVSAPRRGRPKAEIREEIRHKVRRRLQANPKIGWPAIAHEMGLSEALARRVLKEERARAREEIRNVVGGKSSARLRFR